MFLSKTSFILRFLRRKKQCPHLSSLVLPRHPPSPNTEVFNVLFYDPIQNGNLYFFLFCFLTLRQAEILTEKILSIFSIFLLAEGISFHPEISTVPISSQILLQTEILTAKNGLCASPLLLKLKELPAIKANQKFLPQKKSFCLPLHVSPTAIFPPFSGAIGMILSFRLLLTGCQPVPYARSRNTVTEIFSLYNRDSFHAKQRKQPLPPKEKISAIL